MRCLFSKFCLLVWLAAPLAHGAPPELFYFHYDYVYPVGRNINDLNSVIVARFVDPDFLLVIDEETNEILPPGERREEILNHFRAQTKLLAHWAADFCLMSLKENLKAAGLADNVIIGPRAEADITSIRNLQQPFIYVTDFQRPWAGLQLLSVKHDTSFIETRLNRRGVLDQIRPPDKFDTAPFVQFIARDNPMSIQPIVTLLFTTRRWAIGGVSEMKSYYRSPLTAIPWGGLVRRLFVAFELSRFNQTEISPELRGDPRGENFDLAFEAFAHFQRQIWSEEDIEGFRQWFLDPNLQAYLMNSHLVLETIIPRGERRANQARIAMFRRNTGFRIDLGTDTDPDIDGVFTALMAATNSDFELYGTRWNDGSKEHAIGKGELKVGMFADVFGSSEKCPGTIYLAGDWYRAHYQRQRPRMRH
jgi:hypothetical protein